MKPQLRFSTSDQRLFFATLRKRVNQYFKDNEISKNGDARMVLKTISMYAMYLVPFLIILIVQPSFWVTLPLALIMGLGMTGIGFSVMHDANHGSYTKYGRINNFIGHMSMSLIGGSTFTWKVQHNMLHHTYTNIYEHDEDIHDKPMLRLSPHGVLKKHHKYQHIYASFLYMLMTVSWCTQKDFKQLIEYNKTGLTEKSGYTKTKAATSVILEKVIYHCVFLVLPILVLSMPWWQWLIAFFVMHALAGYILAIVFQLAHVVEGTSHHKPTENGTIENTWAIHQLQTTANFSRHNKLITWYVGGLNFQVEHHLFPKICHVHYKDLSEIVKKTAKEFGLPYNDNPNFFNAIGSHFKVLKELGKNTRYDQTIVSF